MMKVLYLTVVGFAEDGNSNSSYEPRDIRLQKSSLLERFKLDGFYLIDAYGQPMPDEASSAAKTQIIRGAFPALRKTIRLLCRDGHLPVVLIGGPTYTVCAEAFRQGWFTSPQ